VFIFTFKHTQNADRTKFDQASGGDQDPDYPRKIEVRGRRY
jgi:hypothetical protein